MSKFFFFLEYLHDLILKLIYKKIILFYTLPEMGKCICLYMYELKYGLNNKSENLHMCSLYLF